MDGGGGGTNPSLSFATSSGASQSGATSQRGGGNYGGTSYGPGSLLLTDQSGSVGANSSPGGMNLIPIVIVLAIVAGGAWLLLRGGK